MFNNPNTMTKTNPCHILKALVMHHIVISIIRLLGLMSGFDLEIGNPYAQHCTEHYEVKDNASTCLVFMDHTYM